MNGLGDQKTSYGKKYLRGHIAWGVNMGRSAGKQCALKSHNSHSKDQSEEPPHLLSPAAKISGSDFLKFKRFTDTQLNGTG
jgi:hypothetical protein